jgi:hypothetical protein
MPNTDLADITTRMATAGLLAPLAGIGRQFSAPGAISHAPRRRLNARSRVSTPDPAFAPRTIRLGAAAESSRPSGGPATAAAGNVDRRNSAVGASRDNRLTVR